MVLMDESTSKAGSDEITDADDDDDEDEDDDDVADEKGSCVGAMVRRASLVARTATASMLE